MTRRTADIIALTVAVLVAIVALLLMDVGADVDAPSSTTTVTKNAVVESKNSKTTTTVTPGARSGAQGQTTVVEKTSPARPPETTITKTMGERSFLERVLGTNGVVVLQIGAVLLAAFAAGAVTQRALLGEYGFKLGTFELSAIAGASTEALDALKKEVAAEITRVEKKADAGLTNVDKSRRSADASLKRDLADAYRRLAEAYRRLAVLEKNAEK